MPMNRTIAGIERLATRSKYASPRCLSSITPYARFQHTKAQARLQEVAKSQRQTSRISPIALAVVGIAGGYGAWTVLQDGGLARSSLNTISFTPFRLVEKEKVSSTSSIFTLEQADMSEDVPGDMYKKGVWSIEIKQPQLQIARAYTPLPPVDPQATGQLRLLVRKERRGEMSNYIHNTPEGDSLELRGPAIEHPLPRDIDRVVFLAGGTGIAPALQIAHALRESGGSISILWANRKREDCEGGKSDTLNSSADWWFSALGRRLGMSPQSYPPIVEEPSSTHAVVHQLNQMKKANTAALKVDYFVDEEGTFIQPQHVKTILSEEEGAAASTSTGEKVIFVSGPEGFLNYWAGRKIWRDGREVQGPLGGALSHMNLEGWKVVKL